MMLSVWMWVAQASAGVDLEVTCALQMSHNKMLIYYSNHGSTASRAFYIDVFLDAPDEPVVGVDLSDYYVRVPALAADSYGAMEVTIPDLDEWGGGWIDVMIDSTSAISETNEDNVKSAISECCYVHTHFGEM